AQFGMKNLEIAIRYGQRALEIDPHYARAWAMIAVCQTAQHIRGQLAESGLSAAENAIALDPTLAEAHGARGRVLADLGRYDEALAAHVESLRLDPDSPDARFNFGRTLYLLGQYEAAIEHFERADQLSEESYGALSFVAQMYQTLGRHAEAK